MSEQNVRQLIDAYFDGELSNANLCKFEETLKENRGSVKLFMKESCFHLRLSMGLVTLSQTELAMSDLSEAVLLDQQLSQQSSLMPALGTGDISDSFSEVLRTAVINILGSAKFLWAIILFSAGLFSLMLFLLFPGDSTLNGPNPFERVTHVSQTVDAVWGEGVKEEDLRVLFKGSKLDLKSGLAQIEYKNGVRVNLEGPAIFIISGKNEGTLVSGKVSAQIVAGGELFAIKASIGKITDLGTEFGVVVDPEQNTDVQVFNGKVELAVSGKGQSARSVETIELVETDAVRVNATKRSVAKILYTPLQFARCYEKLRPYHYDDFSSDTSENYLACDTNQNANVASFSIENGVLTVSGSRGTCSAISKRPLLGVGDFFMADVPGIDPQTSNVFVVVSTQPIYPTGGMGGTFGFCLRREKDLVVEEFDSSQTSPNENSSRVIEGTRIDDPLFGRPIRLVIERRTASDFVFYYESNDGRTRITDVVKNTDLENSKRLYVGVGVQSEGQESKVFDNFIVYPAEEKSK